MLVCVSVYTELHLSLLPMLLICILIPDNWWCFLNLPLLELLHENFCFHLKSEFFASYAFERGILPCETC